MADSSLAIDRKDKLSFYAKAGIPFYWVVNLQVPCVEVYSEPQDRGYGKKEVFGKGDRIDWRFSPIEKAFVIALDDIFIDQ